MTLSPGDYEIEARAMRRGVGGSYDPGDEQIGRQFVSVSGAPVSGIVVVLREPSTLRGRFVFDGIRPPPANPEVFREYYVIAVDDVESEVIRDPAFLERLVPQATRVTLIEGNPIQVSLRRISVQGSGAR
ncbi:MAG: hypothetical protein HY654_03150 [Acidobacteria bacterium]|nr:hypothetical protein [Acidobacteriota bacterium]